MSIFTRAAGPFVIPNNSSDSQTSQQNTSGQAAFITAKVIDFISDPKTLSQSKIDLLKSSATNSALVNSMPVNSIWCQIIESNRLDQHIAYPFFPAHLCFPIKPAEQVWVFYSAPDQVYYWLCRKPGDYISEDVNYTHIDRIVNRPTSDGAPGIEPQKSAKDSYNGVKSAAPNFPQGKTDSVYDKTSGKFFDDANIIKQSQEYNENFIQEAVPRLVRQPGDLVMQGSNNSTIVLGSSDNREGKGIVDIVAGRTLSTSPVVNSRGYSEVDKTNAATADNPQVGVAERRNALARVYLGMNENPDLNFNVSIAGIGGSGTSSCVVLKGAQVRLLGVDDVKITSQASGASVVLQKTGDVTVVPGSGGKVYLAGVDSNQAYLRYDEFEKIINAFIPSAIGYNESETLKNSDGVLANDPVALARQTELTQQLLLINSIPTLLNRIQSSKILGT